ncbi:DUF3644 domain-containing protein [Thalassobacillus pellis]|uniref:DUF3644 domain-containing protein n=1 Tax=Thalassobacillus pellis TaxID=748008 RepID=UPI00195FC140|nr:DUF3644 domain-containing protein [Thalassobacillus pellis]MBM7551236.1 hypothetical protein [Thalassobacillus pellis]
MLRRGKTKTLLESSIESALLAVEVYNKPRALFRVENYITLMIMAWTRLFHAHFNHTIGDKYYYKEGTRYIRVDGEKKAWELKTCINKYNQLDFAVKDNLEFFIGLRNKIEHRHVEKDEIGNIIFGECQSLLYNYENTLMELFGEKYALNESLAFSLQFSSFRTEEQRQSNRKLLSKEVNELKKYIEDYRNSLDEEIFNSQEFSIKLIQVLKISNTDRNDLSVEFVKWDSLSDEDRASYEHLVTIVKDKVVRKEVINPGRLKPSDVVEQVNNRVTIDFKQYDHTCLYSIFSVRPNSNSETDEFETNTSYCHYDEVHGDYVYQDTWVEFIVQLIAMGKMDRETWKLLYRDGGTVDILSYE